MRVAIRPLAAAAVTVLVSNAKADTFDVGGASAIGTSTLTSAAGAATLPSYWSAAGGVGVVYSNLTSATLTVPSGGGEVTLKFRHRHNFESYWDGGAVYVSVNGAPFTYVPNEAFTANGYVGVLSGENNGYGDSSVFTGGLQVFTGPSSGYSTSDYIESVATLGTFNENDTISVQFRGGWDEGTFEAAPNWEISNVEVRVGASNVMLDADFAAAGKSGFSVNSDAGLAGPWQFQGGPLVQFELDASSNTADKFVPDTAGVSIDLSGANLSVVLFNGSLAPGQSYSLFDLNGGSSIQGNYSSIDLPPVAWDLSGLEPGGNGQIVVLSGPVLSYTWNNATPGTYDWETANWDYSPTDPAPSTIWPNGVGTVANLNTATGANTWNVTASSTTIGELHFGSVSGAGHTISGPGKTLVFDNGPINAKLTRGDVSTTNGGTMNFASYQLNSPLDVNYSGTHITSMLIMQGKFTGSGSLNLKNVWGDADWSGFVLDASDHDYTGGTTLNNSTLTLNGTIDTGVTMSNNSLLKINKSGEQAQSSMMGGPITGSGSVRLAEGMTMIFDNNSNSWDGAVQTTGNFPQGLKFSSIKNVGEGPSALGNPLTVDNGRLQMRGVGGGTWEYTGSGDTTDRIIEINNATDLEWHTTLAASGTTTTASPFKITSNLEGNGAAYFYLGGTGAGEWAGVLSDRPWRALRIRKVDSGTWTFSGANTYTDTTEVLGGTLVLAPTGHLKFKVTNSSTNQVKGSGTAQFDGVFDIDTSAVTVFTGSWNIVKVDTLTESFGPTFSVAGFTQDPVDTNLWRMSDGAKNWTLDTTTGNLSLSAAAVITSFNYGINAGIIDQGAKTISLAVANGTDISTVNPTYVLSSGSCDQPSGGVPSPAFSVGGSVQYTVTDGDIVNVYTVTVTEAPPAPGGVSLGLALWLDATDASTMTLDGTTVNEWRDKFGGSNKATKGGGSPTLVTDESGPGALPTVRFNTSSWMNDGVNRAAGPVSIVLVARQTGGSNGRVLSSAGNNWLMGYWGGNRNCAYFEGWVQGPGQGSDTNPHLNVATIGGAGQNSTLYGSDGSGNWVQLASNQGGTQGPNNLQLNGSVFGEHSDCDISEVIVYDRVLTNSEVTTLAGYLNTKYSLGIAMPAPTWAWIKPTAVGTYEWESANWDAPAYPNAQGIAAKCFTQAGNNVWTMNNPITLGQLQFGGDGGAAHTLNGTGTLVFDNGASNAVLSRGSDVSTTTGASINVADITLDSTLNVNISSHLTSVMTISSRIGGTGGLNIIEAWGDSTWPGLVLSGANTYTGNTAINNGTFTTRMTLTNTGSLKFAVTNTGSNKVTGNGTAALNGSFVIDTSAVTATSGSWTLVDVATPIYGATFSVAGFDDSDGDNVWTKTDWNRNWTFTEATGVLGLVYTNTFTETTTVVDTSLTPSVEGQEVTFTASVRVGGNPETAATGSMVFRVDGDVVATVSPLVSGAATYSTSSLAVGSHEITATYSGDGVYTPSVGSLSQTVEVAPNNPYQAWDDLYDADLSDPAGDEDGDGRSNFEEFAFGLDPTDPASSNPIADISELRSAGKFSYTRRVNSGLTYSILYSSDLQSWPQDEGALQDEITPGPGENVETVTVGLSDIPTSDRFFVRVQASTPAP